MKQNNTAAIHAHDNAANEPHHLSLPLELTHHSSASSRHQTHETPQRTAAHYAYGNAVDLDGGVQLSTAHIHRHQRVHHEVLGFVRVERRARIDTLRDSQRSAPLSCVRRGGVLQQSTGRFDGHGSSTWELSGLSYDLNCGLNFDQSRESYLLDVR